MDNNKTIDPLSNPSQSSSSQPSADQAYQPAVLSQQGSSPTSRPQIPPAPSVPSKPKGRKGCWIILIIVFLIIILPLILIYLTEIGKIQIGLDKYYAKVPISELLGGTAINSKTAVTKSLEATKSIKAFDFAVKEDDQSTKGTILNNGDYQFFYGGDTLGMDWRRINKVVYITSKKTPGEWTKTSPGEKGYRMADAMATYFYISPYKIIEIADKQVSAESTRDHVEAGRISVYKINFEIKSSKEKDAEILAKMKSGQELTDSDVDPLYGVGEVQLTLFIDSDYILKKTELVITKYPKGKVTVEYSISDKTKIEEPETIQSLEEAVSEGREKARDARRRSDLQNLSRSIQMYADDNSDLDPQTTTGSPSMDAIGEIGVLDKTKIINLSTAGNLLEKTIVPTYLQAMPKDPTDQYYYSYYSNGYRFKLWAVQEDKTASCTGEKLGDLCFISVSQ